MVNLYYGRGDCTIEGNVGSIIIYYEGNIVIESKLPDGYRIELEYGKLIISSSSKAKNLNELFRYLGKFKIIFATAKDLEGNKEIVAVRMAMDYTELIDSNTEDLTIKTENLKSTYIHGRTFRKTEILPKGVKAGKY